MRKCMRVFSLCFSATALVACGGLAPFSTELINNSRETLHLLAPGENFPDGKLEPGTRRTYVLNNPTKDKTYEFRVGRSGQVLATTTCKLGAYDSTTVQLGAIVSWDGTTLKCVGGWAT